MPGRPVKIGLTTVHATGSFCSVMNLMKSFVVLIFDYFLLQILFITVGSTSADSQSIIVEEPPSSSRTDRCTPTLVKRTVPTVLDVYDSSRLAPRAPLDVSTQVGKASHPHGSQPAERATPSRRSADGDEQSIEELFDEEAVITKDALSPTQVTTIHESDTSLDLSPQTQSEDQSNQSGSLSRISEAHNSVESDHPTDKLSNKALLQVTSRLESISEILKISDQKPFDLQLEGRQLKPLWKRLNGHFNHSRRARVAMFGSKKDRSSFGELIGLYQISDLFFTSSFTVQQILKLRPSHIVEMLSNIKASMLTFQTKNFLGAMRDTIQGPFRTKMFSGKPKNKFQWFRIGDLRNILHHARKPAIIPALKEIELSSIGCNSLSASKYAPTSPQKVPLPPNNQNRFEIVRKTDLNSYKMTDPTKPGNKVKNLKGDSLWIKGEGSSFPRSSDKEAKNIGKVDIPSRFKATIYSPKLKKVISADHDHADHPVLSRRLEKMDTAPLLAENEGIVHSFMADSNEPGSGHEIHNSPVPKDKAVTEEHSSDVKSTNHRLEEENSRDNEVEAGKGQGEGGNPEKSTHGSEARDEQPRKEEIETPLTGGEMAQSQLVPDNEKDEPLEGRATKQADSKGTSPHGIKEVEMKENQPSLTSLNEEDPSSPSSPASDEMSSPANHQPSGMGASLPEKDDPPASSQKGVESPHFQSGNTLGFQESAFAHPERVERPDRETASTPHDASPEHDSPTIKPVPAQAENIEGPLLAGLGASLEGNAYGSTRLQQGTLELSLPSVHSRIRNLMLSSFHLQGSTMRKSTTPMDNWDFSAVGRGAEGSHQGRLIHLMGSTDAVAPGSKMIPAKSETAQDFSTDLQGPWWALRKHGSINPVPQAHKSPAAREGNIKANVRNHFSSHTLLTGDDFATIGATAQDRADSEKSLSSFRLKSDKRPPRFPDTRTGKPIKLVIVLTLSASQNFNLTGPPFLFPNVSGLKFLDDTSSTDGQWLSTNPQTRSLSRLRPSGSLQDLSTLIESTHVPSQSMGLAHGKSDKFLDVTPGVGRAKQLPKSENYHRSSKEDDMPPTGPQQENVGGFPENTSAHSSSRRESTLPSITVKIPPDMFDTPEGLRPINTSRKGQTAQVGIALPQFAAEASSATTQAHIPNLNLRSAFTHMSSLPKSALKNSPRGARGGLRRDSPRSSPRRVGFQDDPTTSRPFGARPKSKFYLEAIGVDYHNKAAGDEDGMPFPLLNPCAFSTSHQTYEPYFKGGPQFQPPVVDVTQIKDKRLMRAKSAYPLGSPRVGGLNAFDLRLQRSYSERKLSFADLRDAEIEKKTQVHTTSRRMKPKELDLMVSQKLIAMTDKKRDTSRLRQRVPYYQRKANIIGDKKPRVPIWKDLNPPKPRSSNSNKNKDLPAITKSDYKILRIKNFIRRIREFTWKQAMPLLLKQPNLKFSLGYPRLLLPFNYVGQSV
ncbi:hypothetical protein PSHT_14291 [Puccinia striiformis]|uniref:Uncharacterized protein n=1 Tax=Puccinia striiformis TaxID=27350 RepID=A0A2S4UKZ4_9BASI|nr:hypothetical protein PSHT_14291 [Puccinia striiformis]